MNKNILLSFDLSTVVCGISLFNIKTKELVSLEYYKFTSEDMLDKAIELQKLIDRLLLSNYVEAFCIEERLKSFRAGGTNANAITKLAALNFHCQCLFKKINMPIYAINVTTARTATFPGFVSFARKIKNLKQKDVAFNFVIKELGESMFPKKLLKSGKAKGKEVFLDESKDMADAWILGRACLLLYFKDSHE